MVRFLILMMALGLIPQVDETQHYPLEKPILNAFETGDFSDFDVICKDKINVNLSKPFNIKGYYKVKRFIYEMKLKYQNFTLDSIEWYERQIDVDNQITTQSLRLKLRPVNSRSTFNYRLIFMLEKKDKKWKIFYLRSLEK